MVLLKALNKVVVGYASYQVHNGMHIINIFEAMGIMVKYKKMEMDRMVRCLIIDEFHSSRIFPWSSRVVILT